MPYPLEIPSIDLFPVVTPVQIRFNDIDILGHLNNTVYFSLYDTGKARFIEAVAGGKVDFRRVEWVIANVDCAFIAPAYFGEEIDVLSRLCEIGEKHIKIEQMLRRRDTGEVKSLCHTVMVFIDPSTVRPAAIPDHWRKKCLALGTAQKP